VVRCADDSLYCGVAVDVAARIATHATRRGARYTRNRGPFEVVLVRRCKDRGAALRLEHAFKRLTRPAKLALVADPSRLTALARAVTRRAARSRSRRRPSETRSRTSADDRERRAPP
jgi:putative endonuclease